MKKLNINHKYIIMNITKENTVAEIVSKKLGSDHVFSKYKIDFCCGGGMTLEAACKENKVEFETLKQEIEAINTKIGGEQSLNDLDISSLIEQAIEEYHNYFAETIPQIMPFAAKVAEVHAANNPEVVEINVLTKGIEIVVTEMIQDLQSNLYPVIEEILNLNNISAEISLNQIEKVKKSLKNGEISQKLIGDTLKEITTLSSHFLAPDDACNSFKFLYEKLHELAHQLHKYMHFENNVLIPKVLKLIE